MASFCTSYIPTTGAAATRAADVASVNTLSPWYNPGEGTFLAEFIRGGFDSEAGAVALFQADDGTTNNRVALRISGRLATSGAQGTVVSGGTVLCNEAAGSVTSMAGRTVRAAAGFQAGVGAAGRDGLVGALTSVAALPTAVNRLNIGQGPGTVPVNGHIRQIRYIPKRLTNAELQALTA